MSAFLPTIVLRHRKENLKKCTLTGLERRDDFIFYTYPVDDLPELEGYLQLKVGAPPLEKTDKGLFVIDGTWRYAERMDKIVPEMEARSLPIGFETVYPRRQEDCPDGLASIEAIYLAHLILGRETKGLLDHYYWKDEFLKKNNEQLISISRSN